MNTQYHHPIAFILLEKSNFSLDNLHNLSEAEVPIFQESNDNHNSDRSEAKKNSESMEIQAQNAISRILKMEIFDRSCEAQQALEHIANKWTLLIIYALTQGTKRYRDLQNQIRGVSPKVLIQTLRNLERCGLVKRKIYSCIPTKVEYSLSPLGETLIAPLAILGEWSYLHIYQVKDAIENYDSIANQYQNTKEPEN